MMHLKQLNNKSRLNSNDDIAIKKYEHEIFCLLKIDSVILEQYPIDKVSYTLLLKNWIKDCFYNKNSVISVAHKINKSKILDHIDIALKIDQVA